jgi:hypothetical protein
MVRRRAEVPAQPEAWEGPIVGEPGVLRTDGDRAECHICGGWYKLLGGHVFQAHGLYAHTYRRLFGLRSAPADGPGRRGAAGPAPPRHGPPRGVSGSESASSCWR